MQSDLEFNLNEGYTAIEQYDNDRKMCPATDIYAFSAYIYRALVGSNPPDAPSRETNDKLMIPNKIAESIPTHVIRALGAGLQIYPENRAQSAARLRELLNAALLVFLISLGGGASSGSSPAAPAGAEASTCTPAGCAPQRPSDREAQGQQK